MNSINPKGKLISIKSDSVLIDGTSLSWLYHYGTFTGNNDTNYYFHTTIDSVVYDSLNTLVLLGATYIKSSWINSDSALTIAESQGGMEFRNDNPNYKITASLGEPLVPNSTPRWYIHYISIDNPSEKIFINIDASEEPLGNVEIKDSYTDLFLYQNYPNPFNPSTKIKYSIPHSSFVTLKIYDILGKEVATLVNEEKSVGNYEINFNAKNLSSGVYFYRMQAGSFTDTKKFILLR